MSMTYSGLGSRKMKRDCWATHLLLMSQGKGQRYCPMDEVEEYAELCGAGDPTPLYSLVRRWIYSEYEADDDAKPWRKVDAGLDGRRPNLGLAGPFQTVSG